MKIVCDACQAKYSIADEKVQGKAFKIRCKKCGHIIVVKSDRAAAGTAAEPQGYASRRPGDLVCGCGRRAGRAAGRA